MKRMDVRKGLRTAGVVLLIACAVLLPGGSVVWADTASEGVIQQARNEAEKLLSLRTAMWLQFTDRWNDYLQDRDAGNPATEPAFASEGAGTSYLNRLVDDKYLPAGFDTDIYSLSFISASGGWLVSVELNEAVASHVPSFLPMAERNSTGVEYTINRPGATAEFEFFVEKNADNKMGSDGKLTWEAGEGEISVSRINTDTIGAHSGGGVEFTSPAKLGTIEGISGNPIAVNASLNMGSNTLTAGLGEFTSLNVTGAGSFDSLSVANSLSVDGSLTVAGLGKFASLEITGGATLGGDFAVGGTLRGADGEFTGTLGAENVVGNKLTATTGELATLKGTGAGNLLEILSNLDMNGHDMTGAGTVSGTTGDFTNLKATGLTLGGNTGKTSATAYDIWAANAKKATNADYATSAGKADSLTGGISISDVTGLNDKMTELDSKLGGGGAGLLGVLTASISGTASTKSALTCWSAKHWGGQPGGATNWVKGTIPANQYYATIYITKANLLKKYPSAKILVDGYSSRVLFLSNVANTDRIFVKSGSSSGDTMDWALIYGSN